MNNRIVCCKLLFRQNLVEVFATHPQKRKPMLSLITQHPKALVDFFRESPWTQLT
jgi:hypothetical protein